MFLTKIIELGTDRVSSHYSVIRMRVINLLSFISILIVATFMVFGLFKQFSLLLIIVLIGIMFLHASVLFLNSQGWFNCSKALLFGVGALGMASSTFIYGLEPNFQYFFLVFVGLPFLFFKKKYWNFVFAYSTITLLVWIYLKYYLSNSDPRVAMNHTESESFKIFNLILTSATIAILTFRFEAGNFKFIKQLNKKREHESVLANISQMFFLTDNFDHKIETALKIIGEEVKCDRIRFQNINEKKRTTSMIYEWCNIGVKPKLDLMQNVKYYNDERLRNILIENKVLQLNDVQSVLADDVKKSFLMEDVKAFILFPIFQKNEYDGYIMYEDHMYNKEWGIEEKEFLRAASAILANALAKVDYEKEMAENQIKLNTLFEESLDPIMIIDPKNSKLVDVNQTTCQIYGYTKEEMLQLSVVDDIETSVERTNNYWKNVMNEQSNRFRATHKTKDGTILDLIVNLKMIKLKNQELIYAIIHNITDEIKAKEIAEQHEKKLNEAQQLAKVGIWEYNFNKEESFWTDELFNILGIPRRDFKMTFKLFLDFVHPDDQDRIRKSQLNHFKAQKQVDLVHRIITGDNKIKYVREHLKSIFDDAGKPIRTIGSMADITDQINIENELRVANETKTKMFSVIAHDLRSPLGQMMQLSEILEDQNLDEQLVNTFKLEQKKLIENTFELLENLLKWAQINSNRININPEKINLHQLITEKSNNFELIAKNKNITISTISDTDCFVYADSDMVKLIFRNLVSNALKFTPSGGSITIKVEEHHEIIVASVTDNGVGISKNNINKILSDGSYYTTYGTNAEKGSGLGLQLVRSFIELNKGTFCIESEEGKGSSFIFTLPKFIR